jgi:hypothetical protein
MKRSLLAILLLSGVHLVFAQGLRVSGKVVSSRDGSTLPGVNIIIKGTTIGTITDNDGNYSISAGSASDSLVFSFISFKTTAVVVGQRTTIDVQLDPEATELEEVVVTGFQEVERKLFTGSSVNLKMADIKSPGMSDASRML